MNAVKNFFLMLLAAVIFGVIFIFMLGTGKISWDFITYMMNIGAISITRAVVVGISAIVDLALLFGMLKLFVKSKNTRGKLFISALIGLGAAIYLVFFDPTLTSWMNSAVSYLTGLKYTI